MLNEKIDKNSDDLTFNKLLEMKVDEKSEQIAEIASRATKEATLDTQFRVIELSWDKKELSPKEVIGKKDVYILDEFEELNQYLDEHLVNLSAIIGNRYSNNIRDEVGKIYREVSLFQEILEEWMYLQRSWRYLESIFSAADEIKSSLAQEKKRLTKIDSEWINYMRGTNKNRRVRHKVRNEKISIYNSVYENDLDFLRKNKGYLEEIQKSLEAHLEKKREDFPRFYFLSNDELLQILAGAKNPESVQPHLKKLFENITSLEFDPSNSEEVFAMISGEGERVGITVRAKSGPEVWLKDLQEQMKKKVRLLVRVRSLFF